jgi:hypothetical protein
LVERQLPKLKVAGSRPVARFPQFDPATFVGIPEVAGALRAGGVQS